MPIVVFVIIFLITGNLCAQSFQDDTITQEIILYGSRPSDYSAGAKKTSIDSADIFLNSSNNLGDIIGGLTGAYVKTYGNGMSSTISLRGTGAEQTNVLWNGFSVNSSALGLSDLSIVPMSGISGVNLQYGSSGAPFGSSSIGGAFELKTTTDQFDGKENIYLQQDAGSYGNYYSNMKFNYGTKKIFASTNASILNNRNNFIYHNNFKANNPEEHRTHSSVQQYFASQNLHWQFSDRSKLDVAGSCVSADREIASPLGAADVDAFQSDVTIRSMADWNYSSKAGNTSVRGGFFLDKINYSNKYLNSVSDIKNFQFQNAHAFRPRENIYIRSGFDVQYLWGSVSGYQRTVSETRSSFFILSRYTPHKILTVNLNLRKPFVSGFDPPLIPTIGADVFLLKRLKIAITWKLQASKGYRVPTLNNRYWPTGNRNLRPEVSNSFESGILLIRMLNKISFEWETTLFDMYVNNWIQWIQAIPDWTPVNIQRVHSRGIETNFAAAFTISKINFRATAAYTYVKTSPDRIYLGSVISIDKQLMYVPLHKASAMLEGVWKSWGVNARMSFNGYRYTTGDESEFLPGYFYGSLLISKRWTIKNQQAMIILRTDNVTNSNYQNYRAQPMPGRTWSISFRLNFISNK